MLIDVQFIMGLLVAGARATGTTASWLITFLGSHPEWKHKATLEVEHLLTIYPPEDNTPSLSAHLASIPLQAWEGEAPILDAIIRETLRIAQPHTAMRRNLGPDTVIDSKTIPSGTFIIYPFSDVHLNPDIYPDPWKFDPSREEAKTPFGYVGWGGGESSISSFYAPQSDSAYFSFRKNHLSGPTFSQAGAQACHCDDAPRLSLLGRERKWSQS